jgi:hypothetical protein
VLANRDPFDFRRLVREQFVDQLLSRVSSPRYLDPPCFDGLFRDRHLFDEQREGGFGGLRGWGVLVAILDTALLARPARVAGLVRVRISLRVAHLPRPRCAD